MVKTRVYVALQKRVKTTHEKLMSGSGVEKWDAYSGGTLLYFGIRVCSIWREVWKEVGVFILRALKTQGFGSEEC